MKIDRSNYETWLIDWLDGNLNDHQIEQLNLFLSQNSDLQEELKEMDSSVIFPHAVEFTGKPELRRTPADISDLQFDYLCAAYAENDLSTEELDDFSLIISNDWRRRNVSEQFMKLKLTPHNIRFGNKRKLLKRSPLQKTIRLSAALISTAASVALLITLSIFVSENEKDNKDNITQLITTESRAEHSTIPKQLDPSALELRQSEEEIIIKTPANVVNKITIIVPNQEPVENELTNSSSESWAIEIIHSVEIPSISVILPIYQTGIQNLALIPLSITNQIQPDERWAPLRFFAKVFRDKILKEGTIDDSPIKGYEIAEAGVTGLNKLLGWEMAFEKNNDENGELKSIYFSSKILKIQKPVNKSEKSY